MERSRRPMSTADLAATGDDLRSRGDEQVVSRSARDAAETFVRADVGGTDAIDAPPPAPPGPRDPARVADMPSPHASHDPSSRPMLFPHDDAERFRTEWSDVQAGFVDSPRQAVERADALIAEAMQRLASTFASERSTLERQWDRGDDVTTEDLRLVLQRYRSFFDRLLSV